MTNGWSGPDPNQFDEGSAVNYELADRYQVNANITISAVRIWATATLNVANRNARIWDSNGSQLALIDIDDTLPTTGWTTYSLAAPINVSSGTIIDVSYSTSRYYGIVSAPTSGYPRASADGLVTATSGRFNVTQGAFPNNATTSFYGVDFIYVENTGENSPPEILGMSVNKADLTVTASVNIDDETPSTVTVTWDWGDGSSNTTGGGVTSAMHTYAAGGTYAVLAVARDSEGLTDSAAVPITLSQSFTAASNEAWLDSILYAVQRDASKSGYFDKVNLHEPKRKPGTGLTAAIWVQSIDPIALASGLASTSARIVFMLRIYSNMLKEPQDAIDPQVMKAVSNLMRRYHDDFDFDGVIRNVDLLGSFGIALSAQAGYLEIDGANFRIMDILIPCIVNDVWPQVN